MIDGTVWEWFSVAPRGYLLFFPIFLFSFALLVLLVQVVWESFLFYLNLSIFVWFVVLG